MVPSNHLVPDVELPIVFLPEKESRLESKLRPLTTKEQVEASLPGQVERASAHVDVEVVFGQRAAELLQVVPGVLVQVRVLQKQVEKMN